MQLGRIEVNKMAENVSEYDDVDLDSDVEIDEDDMNQFTVYENHEIDPSLFEDIDFDEIEFDGFETCFESILPRFVAGEEVETNDAFPAFICDKCRKKYKRENFFKKHVEICGR